MDQKRVPIQARKSHVGLASGHGLVGSGQDITIERPAQRCRAPDNPVSGRGHDTEGDQFALYSARMTRIHDGDKCVEVGDHMVRRHDQHHDIGVARDQLKYRQGHRRRGVTVDWLQQDAFRLDVYFTQLFGDDEMLLFIGHVEWRIEGIGGSHPFGRFL